MKKRISLMLVCILLIINICVPVAAVEIQDHYFNNKPLQKIWGLVQDVGFIVSYPAFSAGKTIGGLVQAYQINKGYNQEDQVQTDQEAIEWLNNGIIVNQTDIQINNDLNDFLKYSIDDYIANCEMIYTYSFDVNLFASSFSNGTQYNTLKIMCADHQDYYYICSWSSAYGQSDIIALIPQNEYSILGSSSNNDFVGNIYNLDTWSTSNSFVTYVWNGTNYAQTNNTAQLLNVHSSLLKDNITWYSSYPTIISSGKVFEIPSFKNINSLKDYSVGNAPYYYNNNTYSNWSNSQGDYTIDSNNKNTTSYSDVINYNQQYYQDHNEYPTINNINEYITNNTTNNNSNNPGGSGSNTTVSGSNISNINNNNPVFNNNPNININFGFPSISGNSVSGNGNSSSGGFFDWISDIGDVIGNFIKNVGQLIADVVTGISETITTVMANIPNLLSTIVEFVYGGLPDELKALVTLGITSVVLVSVIKILRK